MPESRARLRAWEVEEKGRSLRLMMRAANAATGKSPCGINSRNTNDFLERKSLILCRSDDNCCNFDGVSNVTVKRSDEALVTRWEVRSDLDFGPRGARTSERPESARATGRSSSPLSGMCWETKAMEKQKQISAETARCN